MCIFDESFAVTGQEQFRPIYDSSLYKCYCCTLKAADSNRKTVLVKKRGIKRSSIMDARLFSALVIFIIMLNVVSIPQIGASDVDDQYIKEQKEKIPSTENVIEEHKVNGDTSANSDNENVIHESATVSAAKEAEILETAPLMEGKEKDAYDPIASDENLDFSDDDVRKGSPDLSNLEESIQQAPEPQDSSMDSMEPDTAEKSNIHNMEEASDLDENPLEEAIDKVDELIRDNEGGDEGGLYDDIDLKSTGHLEDKSKHEEMFSDKEEDYLANFESVSSPDALLQETDKEPEKSATISESGEKEGPGNPEEKPFETDARAEENMNDSDETFDTKMEDESLDPKEVKKDETEYSFSIDNEGYVLKNKLVDAPAQKEFPSNKKDIREATDIPEGKLPEDQYSSTEKEKIDHGDKLNEYSNDAKDQDSTLPGSDLWEEAQKLFNETKKNHKRAYKLLAAAAELNHTRALERVSYEYLLADYLPRNFTRAKEIFEKLADKGSPAGQQGLALMYGTGTGVNSSQAKSLIYTTFAALGGSSMAQMMLGYRYWGGIGVVQNCESALTHYKKVSKKISQEVQPMGSPAVHRIRLYDELEQGSSGGNLEDDLLQYYQFLADKGDVQAQVGLGQLYFQGARGVDVDYEKAFRYFKQAAEAGNANAQAYLGKMYLEGRSTVEQNNETALQYFASAVQQGNPIGHSGMGVIYLHGKGVPKDYGKAINHFNLAAEQGWPEAQLQLGNMYYHGLGVNRDYQKAVKYFTLASQSGNLLAVYNLASMHANGNGVLRSCHTATELFKSVAERGKWSSWFTEAYSAFKSGDFDTALIKYYALAELGYEAAQSNVAYILEKGESTMYPANETSARALLQWNRAASQGYTVARVKVGDYHFYGLGTTVDYEIAALHYRLASEQQNNAQAMFNLGYMHEQGLGLKKDIHLAKRFYDMAAESNPEAQVPVALAMVKLGAYFSIDLVRKNYKFWERFDIKEVLGKDWDLYVITGLAILLGLILLIRRTQT